MTWWQFALLGAGGGAIVEALAIFYWLARWQDERRDDDGTIKEKVPELSDYLDVGPHAILLSTRMLLGAVAAVLLGVTGQITGPYGSVTIGCAAPVLLAELGALSKVTKSVSGGAPESQKWDKQLSAVLPTVDIAGVGVSAEDGGAQ